MMAKKMMTVTLIHSAQGANNSRTDSNTTLLAKPDDHKDHPHNKGSKCIEGGPDDLLTLQWGSPSLDGTPAAFTSSDAYK